MSVISGFNAVAMPGLDSRMRRARARARDRARRSTDGFLYDDRRGDLSAEEVNTIASNPGVKDYDDISIDFYVARQTYVRERSTRPWNSGGMKSYKHT